MALPRGEGAWLRLVTEFVPHSTFVTVPSNIWTSVEHIICESKKQMDHHGPVHVIAHFPDFVFLRFFSLTFLGVPCVRTSNGLCSPEANHMFTPSSFVFKMSNPPQRHSSINIW